MSAMNADPTVLRRLIKSIRGLVPRMPMHIRFRRGSQPQVYIYICLCKKCCMHIILCKDA